MKGYPSMSSRIVDDWVREGLRARESADAPPNRLFSVDTPHVRPRGFFYLPVPIVLLAVWVLRPAIIAAGVTSTATPYLL